MGHAADRPAGASSLWTRGFTTLALGFFFCCLNASLFALLPYYLELRGDSELVYGAAAGMHGFGGVLAMLLLGGGADRGSRRRAGMRYVTLLAATNLLAWIAMGGHSGWYLLVLALQGVSLGIGLPLLFVWAAELSPPALRTEAFAYIGVAGLAADGLGPLLGELLLATQPLPRDPSDFGIVFLAANLLAPASLWFLRRTPDVEPPPAHASEPQGLGPLLARPAVRAALAGVVLFGGALGVLLSLGKNFVASIGLHYVSLLLGGHAVGAMGARVLLPRLLQHVPYARIVPLAYCTVALSMAMLALTDNNLLLTAAGLTYGVSHGVLFPTSLSRLIDYGGSTGAGRLSTLQIGMFSLGAGVLPTIGGWVLKVSGFPALFAITGAGCVLGAGFAVWAERLHRGTDSSRLA